MGHIPVDEKFCPVKAGKRLPGETLLELPCQGREQFHLIIRDAGYPWQILLNQEYLPEALSGKFTKSFLFFAGSKLGEHVTAAARSLDAMAFIRFVNISICI